MNNLTMSNKFLICFGAILLLLAGSSALSILQLSNMHRSTDQFATNLMPSTMLTGELQKAGDARRMAEAVHITTTDNAVTQAQEAAITDADTAYVKAAASFVSMLDSPTDRANWKAVADARAAYLTASRRAMELSRAGQDQQALNIYTGTERALFDAQTRAMGTIEAYNSAGALAEAATATTAYDTGREVALGCVVFGALLVIGLQFFLRGQISGPIGDLNATMKALAAGNNGVAIKGAERRDLFGEMAKTLLVFRDMAASKAAADAEMARADAIQQKVVATVGTNLGRLAKGDLTVAITEDFPGTYATLKANFNEATSSLRALIGSVSETAGSILTGSNEIAAASEDLARRTEGNAASLEETSAAIQQIDTRLKATAVAAERSVASSEQTMTAVGDGRARTDQAIAAMGGVADSAKGIDSVIEGLDKIAFQTRVLAMNAAVEAGRAGDAGRGFAVVADLVSALAMRAEEEAKRARDQLTVTQSEIASAVDAVQRVEGALTEISTAGQDAASLAHQIATDNLAQASAISEVSAAIGAMDQTTQQNAAMVEQPSAAARNLTSEVAALTEQAQQFEIGHAPSRNTGTVAFDKNPFSHRSKSARQFGDALSGVAQ